MTRSLLAVMAAVALVAWAETAAAHAFLERADPRVGSQVKAAPTAIRLKFTEGVVPSLCRVTVTGPPGSGGAGGAQPAAGDAASLVVPLRSPVPPGTYVVRWRVMSVDTHVTEGDFSFQVKP